ncbi:MAG: hypothetical protein E7441_07670 [Ruminococcaceae bacterium]|nr:hypothetical protein [Oscillospiraceae bacterium]
MKKLFAIILALSMIAAMLPASVVFAADATESYEYKITHEAYGKTANWNMYTSSSGLVSHGYGNVVNGNVWKVMKVLGSAANENVQLNKSGFIMFAAQSDSETAEANANAVVFQLYLGDFKSTSDLSPATEGLYIPTVTNTQDGKQNHYGITDLYLVSSAAVSKNSWKINSIEEVQKIIDSAAKLGSGNESATADVIHLSSENGCKAATATENDFKKTAERLYITGGYYYLIATVTKPAGWIKSSSSAYTDNEVFGTLSGISFARIADDAELASAFTAKEKDHTAAVKNVYGYKSTDTAKAIIEQKAVTTDTVTISTTDTENFIYWAQGLTDEKKILSFEPSFEYTPAEGNNYLVAVYRDTTNKAEFFNANGQREAVLLADDTAPALPERVGYKPATAWVDLDGNTVAPGETVMVSGYNSYVPNYGECISVTVNGTPYNYGDPVTLSCNASPYYQEGKYFKGWKKDGVIVSTDDSYSFLAYKDTTVTAEWADAPFNFSGNGRKIVLDFFNNALMAEFIGFGNDVVEKGIMFTDTTKTRNIAMTSGSSQFVIVPDEAGTYNGYAIVEDSDGTQTLVTDGEYIKAAE